MIKWLKIAFRNIVKNKRRSFITIIAIATGFAAVNLFSGYIHNTYSGLRSSAIRGSGIGHLTIFKKGWDKHGFADPDTYMLTGEETREIKGILEKDKNVLLVTPKLNISGLVSNGRTSRIFIAAGVVPKDDRMIRESTGPAILKDSEINGIEMGGKLAENLLLSEGGDAVVMASTLDGQMNALDIVVNGVKDTGISETNDKFIKVPFTFAQSLYDTEKADRITILLDDWEKTEVMKETLINRLAEAGIDCEIKTWRNQSPFYRNVKNMFDMIFLFIFSIVLVIVIMSIVNTMGIAVIERTREIGTLRALGLKKRGISFLFALEGGLIGLMGSVLGALVFSLVCFLIYYGNPSYTPPGSSSPVPLMIDFLPGTIMFMACATTTLALISAIVPAKRAAKMNIVNALGHI